MKKIFKKFCVCLCVLGMGGMMTGCDENSPWLSIFTEVLQGMLGVTDADATAVYEGNVAFTMYNYNAANNTYNKESAQTAKSTLQVKVLTEEGKNSENGYVQFTFNTPVVVGGITLKDLTFTTYYKDGVISPEKDTYLTGGTCTYNGVAGTDISAACFEGALSTSQLRLTRIYIQVADKLFMGTFDGAAVTDAN